jgi:N utilization substance protein A
VKGGDTPVEDFVGPGGAFIKPIVQALDGEVIDIVPEDPDPARAVTLALAPARLVRIYLDEEAYAMDLVVVDEDLDKARGPEGQHLQLVSNLTGWTLAVYTETRDEEMRQQARATFGQVLGLDEAQIDSLVAWGFLDLQTIAAADSTELASILGYSPEQVRALQARAAQKP